jgi:hypothetical protein
LVVALRVDGELAEHGAFHPDVTSVCFLARATDARAFSWVEQLMRRSIKVAALTGTTSTDHLNAKPDGYSYAKLVQANSNGSYGFNNYLNQGGTGGVLVASTITVQTCREHFWGDDCAAKTITR